MNKFIAIQTVRFSQIDAAGIVFYPRYFEMISATVEDWFAGPLELSFAKMHFDEKAGIPLVDIHCKFFAPSRLGDELRFELGVTRIGQSSISLQIEVSCQRQQRLKVEMTIVYVDGDDGKPVSKPLPVELRRQIQEFLIME